jgi:hypothetical protein
LLVREDGLVGLLEIKLRQCQQTGDVQMSKRVWTVSTMVLGLSMATAVPALADAIDGDWCFGASSLFVKGPDVRTPGGSTIKADYDRHGIRYVVPASEPGAGAEVVMRLLNEENALMTKKGVVPEAAPETWKRCKPIS